MSPAPGAVAARPVRWGLAARLFAILLLLGAVAVLVTGVLGYIRARDALQESIYNQLTAARKSKARQIETYFATIRNELTQLASAKMTIDAARAFRSAYDELEQSEVPFDLRRKVGDWYQGGFPARYEPRDRQGTERRRLPAGRPCSLLPPVPLHRHQSAPEGATRAGRRSRRRQHLHEAARHLSSADARRRHRFRLLRPVDGRSQGRSHILHDRQGSGFRGVASSRQSPAVQRLCRRRPLRRFCRSVGRVLRGLCPLRAVARRPHCLHGSAGDRPGCRRCGAGRPIVDRGDRRCRDRRSQVAPGGLRRHGRGLRRRARSPRALGPAGVLRDSRPVLRRPETRRRVRTRTSTPSAVTARRFCTSMFRPTRLALRWPASRAPARSSAIAASRPLPRGGRSRLPAPSGR